MKRAALKTPSFCGCERRTIPEEGKGKGRDKIPVMLLLVDSIQLVEYSALSSLYGVVEWCPPRRQCTVHVHPAR